MAKNRVCSLTCTCEGRNLLTSRGSMHIDLWMERVWEVWRRWVGAALVGRDHFP